MRRFGVECGVTELLALPMLSALKRSLETVLPVFLHVVCMATLEGCLPSASSGGDDDESSENDSLLTATLAFLLCSSASSEATLDMSKSTVSALCFASNVHICRKNLGPR